MIKSKLPIVLCVMLLATSCIKETLDDLTSIKGVKANPTFALPLLNATIGLGDLIKNVDDEGMYLIADSSGQLEVRLQGEKSVMNKQFLTVPKIMLNADVNMPENGIPIFEAAGSFSENFVDESFVQLDNNAKLEHIEVKDGYVDCNITSMFKHDVFIKITYLSITTNTNQVLVDTFNLSYNGSGHSSINRRLDLNNYIIDFSKNGTTYNIIPYQVEVSFKRVGTNPITSTEKISIVQGLEVKSYRKLEGYLGKMEIMKFVETNRLPIFDKKIDGNVYIKNPELRIRVEHALGVPITGKFTRLDIESGKGNIVAVTIQPFKDTFSLGYTTIDGEYAVTEYVINSSNSNIADILSMAPQSINMVLDFTANYDDQFKKNLLTDKANITVKSVVSLPIELRVLDYAMQQDGVFDLISALDGLDSTQLNVDWVEVITDVSNGMPMASYLQIYLDDTVKGITVDSLFDTPALIPEANVDQNGHIISLSKRDLIININKAKYLRMQHANKYRVVVRLKTSQHQSDFPYVPFNTHQKMTVKSGIKSMFTIKSK